MMILADSSILQMLVLFKVDYTTTKLTSLVTSGHENNGQRHQRALLGTMATVEG